MVRPETDLHFINRIVNSPAVRPFVDYSGTQGPVDLAPAVGRVTQTGIVWLSNGEDALAAFPQTADRDYQAHLFFDETCRGARALAVARDMIDWMRRCADVIWGAIPVGHARTLWFARQLGFQTIATDDYEGEGPVAIVSLRLA